MQTTLTSGKRNKYEYQLVYYNTEDTLEGTGVKLEMFIPSFVSNLQPHEIEQIYKKKLDAQLRKEVAKTGSKKFGHGHFMVLKKEETLKPKSRSFKYKAYVVNISPFVHPDRRHIKETKTKELFI